MGGLGAALTRRATLTAPGTGGIQPNLPVT